MKQRIFELRQNYFFLCAGAILKQNILGDYYVTFKKASTDPDWIRIRTRIGGNVTLPAELVEGQPDLFAEVGPDDN